MDVVSVVVAGLGGQGVITASDIVADAAFRSGHDVKKAEVHGMSQRGGSVSTDVRFGARVLSPMVPEDEADYLVVLAADQVEVFRHRLRPGGVLIEPSALGGERLPHPRSLNVALVGVLSAHLEIPDTTWLESIRAALDPKLHPVNERAFDLGRRMGTASRAGGGLWRRPIPPGSRPQCPSLSTPPAPPTTSPCRSSGSSSCSVSRPSSRGRTSTWTSSAGA